jgi:LPS-assembly lipoprotein
MDRRGLLLALATLTVTGGCGFQPVYDRAGSGVGPLEIPEIEGRVGYLVRQELLRRAALETGPGPVRRLDVRVVSEFTGVSTQITGFATRTQMRVHANWRVVGADTKEGFVTTQVGYDGLNEAFGDIALQADAEERAATQLADRLWLDLVRKARAAPGPR